jgi:hypothetical protein
MKSAIISTLVAGAAAHGSMTYPKPRNAMSSPGTNPSGDGDLSCVGDACFWYHVGCSIGCPECYNKNVGKTSLYAEPHCTKEQGLIEPTNNDPEYRSWNSDGDSRCGDFTKYNPWRAPGKSPVNDPCGQASGFGDTTSGAEVPMGYSAGDYGSQVLPATEPMYWKAGGTAQVGWALSAQHGGGYSYRLCPKSQFGKDPQAIERCFQSNHLKFASSNSTIHFDDNSHADISITGKIYTPEDGRQWKLSPIPGCACDNGLACGHKADSLRGSSCTYPEGTTYTHKGSATPACPTGTMFEPQFTQFTQGYLTEFAGQQGGNKFSVMDEVVVPNEPGEYILGWRWDCEETDQVWASCADIVITDGPTPAPTPPAPTPPTPAPTPTPSPSTQCDGFKPDFTTFACYYKGCAQYTEGSKDCEVCCEGCHLQSDPTKGTFCMEDKEVV